MFYRIVPLMDTSCTAPFHVIHNQSRNWAAANVLGRRHRRLCVCGEVCPYLRSPSCGRITRCHRRRRDILEIRRLRHDPPILITTAPPRDHSYCQSGFEHSRYIRSTRRVAYSFLLPGRVPVRESCSPTVTFPCSAEKACTRGDQERTLLSRRRDDLLLRAALYTGYAAQ
jgi:hypothetical protein